MLFSKPIDPLAAAGAILAKNWTEHPFVVVDQLGDEFLDYVARRHGRERDGGRHR
jgi:hypothetical protein